jgi:hypothetical protein
MLRKTAILAGSVVLLVTPPHLAAQDAPIRLELNEVAFRPEPAHVRLVIPSDGYLMLLHVADGGVHVMFPVKPGGSAALAAGDYTLDQLDIDLPFDNGRRAGILVAAWSPTLIRTDKFVRYGHWAVSDLSRKAFSQDPAVATIELITRLGATPGSVAAAEYGSIRSVGVPQETVSLSYAAATNPDDYPWKVIQNLIRMDGRVLCPSGTRDVTGAGEACTGPPDRPRSSPRATPMVEPAYVPPSPLQSPAARTAASPALAPATTPPPAPEQRPSRKPL